MSKVFPSMYSKPENSQIFSIIPCWILAFLFVHLVMPLLGIGLWEQAEFSAWLVLGYHVLNGVAMFLLMRNYLKDEWFMFTSDFRYYLKHIALTVGLILGTELLLLVVLVLCGFNIGYVLSGLPVVEIFISHTPHLLVTSRPLFATIVLSVFTPVSICALFYCLGFAPVCCKKPWLAYLCIAVLALIPPLVHILWQGNAQFVLSMYVAHLPVHLLACWSYQKTDNVWTPIASLAVANLLFSLLQLLLFR